MDAHNTKPVASHKAFRKWDGKTPYSIHPIWCAMTLLHETALPGELRSTGAEALLMHDILEDTTADLPGWTSDKTRLLVNEMTFASTDEEMNLVWSRRPFVRLLKLYDKVSNLMDGAWMSDGRRRAYIKYTRKLADDVGKNFGELNIVKITRALTINLATP